MNAMLNLNKIQTLEDIRAFLKAPDVISHHTASSGEEKAQWVRRMLMQLHYRSLGKKQKGLVRKYLKKITGYSDAQLTRHIKAYKELKPICQPYERNTFPSVYSRSDQELLAYTDNLHSRINGAATVKICKDMLAWGDERYERLAKISVSHLYRLRKADRYIEVVTHKQKTKAVQRAIGERVKPDPQGQPGYIRVDSVHQGDLEGEKGVYHINLVDEITQWEVVVAVEGISERFLIPALEMALSLFPFKVINFHSDNGSEYINRKVALLLNKLIVTQTKSRSRKSNDNGLAEGKNGAIIRKHMGHAHIPRVFAPRITQFYVSHLIPYLNFHRPCAFPEVKWLENGKKKITYPAKGYKTPCQKLLSLKKLNEYLKEGVSIEDLKCKARENNPNQAASQMQKALTALRKNIHLHHSISGSASHALKCSNGP